MTRACSQGEEKLSAVNELGTAERQLGPFKLLISLYNPCRGLLQMSQKIGGFVAHGARIMLYSLGSCGSCQAAVLLQCSRLDIPT